MQTKALDIRKTKMQIIQPKDFLMAFETEWFDVITTRSQTNYLFIISNRIMENQLPRWRWHLTDDINRPASLPTDFSVNQYEYENSIKFN